jgi:hypothetical protein
MSAARTFADREYEHLGAIELEAAMMARFAPSCLRPIIATRLQWRFMLTVPGRSVDFGLAESAAMPASMSSR